MSDLFDPLTLGRISLANRIIMAPMTRSRAGEGENLRDHYRGGCIVAACYR